MKIVLKNLTNKDNNKPINYLLITDLSGSMNSSIAKLKATLISLKENIKEDDTISLGWFSGYNQYGWVFKGLKINDRNYQKLIEEKIYSRAWTNFTQILGSLSETMNDVKLISENDNFALYFMTDGWCNDQSPEKEIYRLCTALKCKFNKVSLIGYGANYNRNVLLNMTEAIGGQFNHISDFEEMKSSCNTFFKGGRKKQAVHVVNPNGRNGRYDFVWQVTDCEINTLEQDDKNFVHVEIDDTASDLYAINISELKDLSAEQLADGRFVYSLAYMLSQKNKVNLAVSVLKQAGDKVNAAMLRKAFTVMQKGKAENDLKMLAIVDVSIVKSDDASTKPLTVFLEEVKKDKGNLFIDLDKSEFSSISRKGEEVSKVTFETTDKFARIVGVTQNENKPNISFLTSRKGVVTGVNDDSLKAKITEYNLKASKKIEFPIKSETYRNYAFVANGDFNFKKLNLFKPDGCKNITLHPEKDLDIFDENVKEIKIKDFVNLYRQLILEKARISICNWYIANNSDQKHINDIRVDEYGKEGSEILAEMGLDYQMRYSPKKEYVKIDETADFIPFLEIDGYIKGASTITVPKSYEKFLKGKNPNIVDNILWSWFEKYDALKEMFSKEDFVQTLQTELVGISNVVDLLSTKISNMKFYLITTNSWFVDYPEKKDEIEYDNFVLKVKETKVYL